jgi:hypothetical protein
MGDQGTKSKKKQRDL